MTSKKNGLGGVQHISPLFNDAFLKIFGSQDSKDMTRSLVNAILRRAGLETVGEVSELRADVASAGGISLRTARVDVLIVSEEGEVVDLEAERRHSNVNNKLLFYASKLLWEHMPKGSDDDYNEMPRVISITLLEGHTMFDDEEFVNVGRVRWKRNDDKDIDGTDRMLFVVVELDKIKERYTANNKEVVSDEALAWLYLLANGYRDNEEMDAIVSHFPTIEEFAERYKIAMGDPELKRAYERYYEARLEYNQMMHDARREGLELGRDEGRKEGRKEGRDEMRDMIASRMRDLGYKETDIEDILQE